MGSAMKSLTFFFFEVNIDVKVGEKNSNETV